ncbi:MAG: tRNA dimethylallyltransferase [candidate division TM6 bacterium GW2011_GWE2_41_16]|nr:MAG: tRNA dimethylallyltransferase [candidate division TM6 bacterium GW2011_GWE2_41_16]
MKQHSVGRYIFCGPTAGGKSSFSELFCEKIDGEIINADACQWYTPLTIGTAKPDLGQVLVPHHLFNIVHDARVISIMDYAHHVQSICLDIESRNKTACLVGGSSFYLYSLFFAHHSVAHTENASLSIDNITWDHLNSIDPLRAQEIHPHDAYRIQRALEIFYKTGERASSLSPRKHDFGATVVFVEREKEDLWNRMSLRIDEMLASGWIDEVAGLSEEWCDFVKKRNIIGYPQIIEYLSGALSLSQTKELIHIATRQYAKKQATFNRRFKRMLQERGIKFLTINLTLCAPDLYLKQLLAEHFDR